MGYTSAVEIMPRQGDDGGGHADETKLGEELRLNGGERRLLQVVDHGRAGPERHPELHAELGGDAQQRGECQILRRRKQENATEGGKPIKGDKMKYQIRSTWLDAIDMRATLAPVIPDTAMVSLCGSLKKPLPKNAPIVTPNKDSLPSPEQHS